MALQATPISADTSDNANSCLHDNNQQGARNSSSASPNTERFVSSCGSPLQGQNLPLHERSRSSVFTEAVPSAHALRTIYKLSCVFAALVALLCWWRSGSQRTLDSLRQRADELTERILLPPELSGLKFIPASNPELRFVGRWLQSPNRLRSNSNFGGAYVEFGLCNCSSLYLSLHNTDPPKTPPEVNITPRDTSKAIALDFGVPSEKTTKATPASLLSRVDDGEYTVFRQSGKGLVAIAAADMDAYVDHVIRITASSMYDDSAPSIQFRGIWISNGAVLMASQNAHSSIGVLSDTAPAADDSLKNSLILDLNRKDSKDHKFVEPSDCKSQNQSLHPRKIVEIVSDLPRILHGQSLRDGFAASIGWEQHLGDMFKADRVSITLDGACLISPCGDGAAQSASIQDAFFRSGPPGSSSFSRSWNFRSYVPDALVLALGYSDTLYFVEEPKQQPERTTEDLLREFEGAYVRFVQAIRRAAYPLHPAALQEYRSDGDGYVYNSAPATIPIFVVAPFTGEMRHSTQKVVQKLQSEGDKAVFWLDTCGWFCLDDFNSEVSTSGPGQKRSHLNSQGNRKAATLLYGHLCHYLAKDAHQCPFLKHEAYTGPVYVPKEAELGKLMEESKVRKLKALFWPAGGSEL